MIYTQLFPGATSIYQPPRFVANGEAFVGRTLPGCARVRIFRESDKTFFVAFDPEMDQRRKKVTWGVWTDIHRTTDLAVLPLIAQQVLTFCDQRYRAYQDMKTGHDTKPSDKRGTRGSNGFDDDYFID